MAQTIPNVQLRAWRNAQQLSRAEMARAINERAANLREPVTCDEEPIRRWESGEVLWPSPPYRRVLENLTGERAIDLGFIPPGGDRKDRTLASPLLLPDAMSSEATLFDTLELAQMADATDISASTLDALTEAADLLCRAYPTIPARTLRDRVKQRLHHVMRLLGGRVTLAQHRDLLVDAGWLSLLLGCLHFDLGERALRPGRTRARRSRPASRLPDGQANGARRDHGLGV